MTLPSASPPADTCTISRRGALAVIAGAGLLPARPALSQSAEPAGIVSDTVTVPATPRPMTLRVLRPGAAIPVPGVLIVPERGGVEDWALTHARRFAAHGMLAVIPDFLSAHGEDAEQARDALARTSQGDRERLLQLALDQVPRIAGSNGSLGIVAFQAGATLSLPFINQIGRAKAAALFDIAAEKSERWAGFVLPVQFHIAGQDQRIVQFEAVERRLMGAAKVYEQYTYPGVQPGFAFDPQSRIYDTAAADLAFARTLAFFRRRLSV